jgi:WD40 repeat protein
MESHAEGEIWGAALDPKDKKMLVTTGDDNKIRCWDLSQRRCISTGIIETALFPSCSIQDSLPVPSQQSRAVCISPCGHVAVGHNDGHVTIRQGRLQINNILAVLTDAKDCVMIISYSPSASFLAIGSNDCCVYMYDVSSGYKLFFRLEGHTGPVVALDWSIKEDMLKTCSFEGELLHWELQSESKLSPTDAKVIDEKWATWTSAAGWPVRGINQVTENPDFITNVSRSQDQKYVAVGNTWGLLELYRYPNGPGSLGKAYRAHSLEIANILWTAQDRGLVTVGGPDLSILQWRITSNLLTLSS